MNDDGEIPTEIYKSTYFESDCEFGFPNMNFFLLLEEKIYENLEIEFVEKLKNLPWHYPRLSDELLEAH